MREHFPMKEAILTFDSQFLGTVEAILTEAAKRAHESTGFENQTQLVDKAAQISMAIKASMRSLVPEDPARQEPMRTIVASLKRDSIKCQTLLTSQLSPEDFVRDHLKSLHPDTSFHQEPSSSSSNGKDDISKVCNFQRSQQTPPSAIPDLTQPTAEVGKSQQIADPVNSSSLSSSTLQPASMVVRSQNFKLLLPSELKQYLESHEISNHGSREEVIARCEARDQEIIAQRTSALEDLAAGNLAQTEEQPIKEAAGPDTLPPGALSVSSDGPPPNESLFQRFFNGILH
jgi:hypothetical protein